MNIFFKRSRVKKLVSSAVLCAMFSTMSFNGAFAETIWDADRDITADETVNDSLVINNSATITNSNALLSVLGDSVVDPAVPADMTISDGSSFENASNASLSVGNNLSNESILKNNSGSTITIGNDFSNVGSLTNSGTITANKLTNSGTIGGIDDTYGDLTIQNGGSSTGAITQKDINFTGGTFENKSDLTANNELEIALGAVLGNTAEITANTLTNLGTIGGIDDTYGDLTIQNGGSSTGAITQDNITFNGGTFTNNNTLTANESLTVNTGATLTNTSTVIANNLTNSGTINGSGTLNVSGDSSSTGAISQGTLNVTSGTFNSKANVLTNNINVSETAVWSAEGAVNTGNLTNDGTVHLANDSFISDLQNKGTIDWTGPIDSNKIMTISAGKNSSNLTQGIIYIVSSFENTDTGVINAISTGAGANTVRVGIGPGSNATLSNNGTINTNTLAVEGTSSITGTGDLTINKNGYSSGSIIQDNITLISGDFSNNSNSSLTANEQLTINQGVVFNNNTNITTATLINEGIIKENGTLEIKNGGSSTGSITQKDINFTGGTFENKGDLTANNELEIASGAVLGNIGEITANTLTNSGTIGGVDNAYGDLTIQKGGTSSGDITQYSINLTSGTFTNTATMTAAEFTNSAIVQGEGTLSIIGGDNASSSTGEITQKEIEIYNGTFNNNAKMTATSKLSVGHDEDDTSAVLNNSSQIIAKELYNYDSIEGSGQLTIQNGGLSEGSIIQDKINFNAGEFENKGKLTADIIENKAILYNYNGEKVVFDADELTNEGTIYNGGNLQIDNLINKSEISVLNTPDATYNGNLTVKEGSNSGSITQNIIKITGATETIPAVFANEAGKTIYAQSTLEVGANTTLKNEGKITVSDASNITQSINARLINGGIIDNLENAILETAMLKNDGTINLINSELDIYAQKFDIGGTINVKGGGETGIFVNGEGIVGEVNVTEGSTLYLSQAEILEEAELTVEKGSVVHLYGPNEETGAELTINANDSYKGDVIVENGALIIDGVDITFGKESTVTSSDENPYLETTTDETAMIMVGDATVTMQDSSVIKAGDLVLTSGAKFNSLANSFTVNNLGSAGLLNAINGTYENYEISDNLAIIKQGSDNTADFAIDLYAKSKSNVKYDSFGSDSTIIINEKGNGGTINISDWNMQGDLFGADAPTDKNITLNIFNGTVEDGQEINFTATNKEVLTPIGYYKLTGNSNGSYTFGMDRYNPTAFRGQITKMAQYQNQLAINDMIFNHSMIEQGFKGNDLVGNYSPNKYASSSDVFAPYQYSRKDGGLWIKNYANFERLNMNHGLSVGNNAYGSIIGADFGLKELKNGWSFMPTAYVGYNGANQHWNGTRAYQNGAQMGFMGSWYKDNLILAALTYAGMYGNSMDTPRGTDETMNYFAGAATKAAYNLKLTENLALQPSLLLAYSYFGQENWHTDFGQMGMMSGMLHGVNIAPGLNLIWEKDTFSAYATVQYMYNINQSIGGRAANVEMANVHMDRGYLQYGVGVNKKFTDKFSGYLQTIIRNVGRTGIAFMLGFNWKLGKKESNKNVVKSDV